MYQNDLAGLLNTECQVPIPVRIFDSAVLWWGLRIHFSQKFPEGMSPAGPEPHFENHYDKYVPSYLKGLGRGYVVIRMH